MNNQQGYLPSSATEEVADPAPMYFPVSLTKLVVMSFCTFGLYEIYWFYKNWSLINQREDENIMPVLRTFFAPVFCYSLFTRIQEAAEEQELPISLASGFLAGGWLIHTLLWRLPDPYWMVTFLAVIFLLPVQSAVNDINQSVNPQHDPNSHFSRWDIAVAVIGVIIFMLGII
jgi:hypothetical protein